MSSVGLEVKVSHVGIGSQVSSMGWAAPEVTHVAWGGSEVSPAFQHWVQSEMSFVG